MQNDEQEIRQLVATWMSATTSGDVKAVLELMADDVVFFANDPRRNVSDAGQCRESMSR